MIRNLSLRNQPKFKREPAILDADDPGDTATDYYLHVRDQDDAFCAAVRKQIHKGRLSVKEGIKQTPPEDARVVRTIRAVAFVPSRSALENV